MSRCLRCDAGPEWIEGNVKDEPAARPDRAQVEAALRELEDAAVSFWAAADNEPRRKVRLTIARAALLALIFPEEP